MRLTAVLLIVGCFLSATTFAQSRVEQTEKPAGPYPIVWDVAVAPGFVVKRGYQSDLVLGVETRIEKKINPNVAWMASVGYTSFPSYKPSNFAFITGKAGLKTFLAAKVYVAGEIGFGEYINGGEAFVYSVSFGIKAGSKWDLSLKFEDFSSTSSYPSQVALRVGYKISKK